MHRLKPILYLIFGAGLFAATCTRAHAQEQIQNDTTLRHTQSVPESALRTLQTTKVRAGETITLDGNLDEAIWQTTSIARNFIQRDPADGEPATEKTEAQVIYTDDVIYVGIKAYDSAMDSIAATLFRKDGTAYSDWVYVSFDSYNDDRTSFNFAVNPKGVRKDILIFDNDREDIRWDAVWQAETQINEDNWTVEIRIPLSQLRYSSKQADQTWGVNFQRRIARKEEIAFWSPTPQDASGFVSQYGQLEGIAGLEKPGRLEFIPYASSSLTRAPSQAGNPFYETNDWASSVGGDIRYGLTSDLTLTATINPDFGQVEADPAVINLSAFETFFPEQRPFFLEGNEIFQFGNTKTYNSYGNPLTFYSRRIGRAPQGNLSRFNRYNDNAAFDPDQAENVFTNLPDQTTIAGAAKISGKTRSGWSIGLLDAYTLKETSPFEANLSGSNTTEGNFPVEPATNYLVSRTKKDFNGGNSVVGGFLSATNRSINDRYFEEYLHSSAYVGGLDFEHNWDNRNWAVSGTFSASQVNGSKEAILRTQQSPVRYYNRVDSEKLSVDPGKTSLNGLATELSLRKSGGEHWHTSLTYSQVSPGYETNDLGFQNRADYRAVAAGLIYQESDSDLFRFYEIWGFHTHAWNYDGDIIGNFYNAGGYLQFNNLWSFNVNINFAGKAYVDRLTRGGPVAERVKDWNFNLNINSDQTKKVSFNAGTSQRWDFAPNNDAGEFDHYVWAGIEIRPVTNIQFSISPELGI
ncbi:MAG: carbohydrate binding family 9 domain-containing protein, partial [Balneolaceae bacterium]|nr:carbohydrate binding family 9 domain-containing protein [Balneolaceae bacterium]